MQNLPQSSVFGEPDIRQSLVEACNCATIHFFVLPVPAMYLDDCGLVTIGIGIGAWATENFSPVCSESLHMLWVDAVPERMTDYFVGHHAEMPGISKTA